MIKMTLAQAARILGLNVPAADIEFNGISIDTRTLHPGCLFAAIRGEHLDGHDYAAEAAQKGAVAALVSRQLAVNLPQLITADTTLALGKLGAAWRNAFHIPFIAVTGSNGKTTTKNMLASIMKAACGGNEDQVLATKGTLNNHWGLPLTLALLNHTHHYAAIEMGMNHFGEIKYLTELTRPDVAVITNASAAHLAGVGSIEGVARAKAEIFLGLPENGTAILNRDDAFYDFWTQQIGSRKHISFGFHPEADVQGTLHPSDNTFQRITMKTPAGTIEVNLPLLGKHNAANALAAAAACLAVGIDIQAVKSGLETIAPAPGRLIMHTLANGVKIIDDTYNANPTSLQAAVETLSAFAGKKILVLGDMRELGDDAKNIHQHAGEKIRSAGIDYLFTFGDLSENTSHAFGEGAYHFSEQEKLVNALKPFLFNTTTILVKGSRSMKMERVIAGLVG
ncbi:MAG TPA: UDP-N-acetylmuramoyl-tripeptide--D-alanyl-D-alanine ligase [Gammaproteobacteria bacterium]|nr:UDP-N-acetylmuramoyl-tripeptide--D-alanyl-D-alanine ligase [Gammaproteobacteria bacterium]